MQGLPQVACDVCASGFASLRTDEERECAKDVFEFEHAFFGAAPYRSEFELKMNSRIGAHRLFINRAEGGTLCATAWAMPPP